MIRNHTNNSSFWIHSTEMKLLKLPSVLKNFPFDAPRLVFKIRMSIFFSRVTPLIVSSSQEGMPECLAVRHGHCLRPVRIDLYTYHVEYTGISIYYRPAHIIINTSIMILIVLVL